MHQFTCSICGDGFEQRSRYERHLQTAHPPSAMTAADLEKALAGIEFPASQDRLVQYAGQRLPEGSAVLQAIKALPKRSYRDAAEVGIAFGETKRPEPERSAEEVAQSEPPSRRGGHAAASAAVSAAAVAKLLGGIDFPKSKAGLLEYGWHHHSKVTDPGRVLGVLARMPERPYTNMADVEVEVGRIL